LAANNSADPTNQSSINQLWHEFISFAFINVIITVRTWVKVPRRLAVGFYAEGIPVVLLASFPLHDK